MGWPVVTFMCIFFDSWDSMYERDWNVFKETGDEGEIWQVNFMTCVVLA